MVTGVKVGCVDSEMGGVMVGKESGCWDRCYIGVGGGGRWRTVSVVGAGGGGLCKGGMSWLVWIAS